MTATIIAFPRKPQDGRAPSAATTTTDRLGEAGYGRPPRLPAILDWRDPHAALLKQMSELANPPWLRACMQLSKGY